MPLTSSKYPPYMREHSNVIRCIGPNSHLTVVEDDVFPGITSLATMKKSIVVMTCRNRQRQLQHAWQKWVYVTDVHHDYQNDMITILSRPLAEDELRTELEVEVIFKWVLQNHHVDPTGLAYTLYMCKSKVAIVNCIQQCRLERYPPCCPILLQNDLPRPEEGHFTVLTGRAEILIFPPDSMQLLQLHTARKNSRGDEEIQRILDEALFIDVVRSGSGFGELSTITKMKRSATVRAHADGPVEVLVIPNFSLLGLLEHRHALIKEDAGNAPASAEVMDYLRQSGLVYKAAMVDVMEAASCMRKREYPRGCILFKKNDVVDRLYIVLYGELLLDTQDYAAGLSRESRQPFQHLDHNKCHILKSGSIIGDEGMVGKHSTFESSSIVISESASCFEVTGFGIAFLASRLGVEKYSALVYKDEPLETGRVESLNDDLILHSTFHSLRKSIAAHCPFRGKALKAVRQPLILKDILVQEQEHEHLEGTRLASMSTLRPPCHRPKSSSSGQRSPGKRNGMFQSASPLDTPAKSVGRQSVHGSPMRSVGGASKSPQKTLPHIGVAAKARNKDLNRSGSSIRRVQSRQSGKCTEDPNGHSSPGRAPVNLQVLSAAAMHHVQSIQKLIRKRDIMQMRNTAKVRQYGTLLPIDGSL